MKKFSTVFDEIYCQRTSCIICNEYTQNIIIIIIIISIIVYGLNVSAILYSDPRVHSAIYFLRVYLFFNWKKIWKRKSKKIKKDGPVVCNCQQRHYYSDLHLALNRFINKAWITFVIVVAQITFEWFVSENGKCDRFLF